MKHFLCILSLLTIIACRTSKPEIASEKEWKLIWEDDFNEPELDLSKWTKIPANKPDWAKHMSDDPRCYEMKDGMIYLKGIWNKDKINDEREFLTGGIYTKGKFSFQYGKIEIRAKMEGAQGAWPAMWMLAQNNKYGSYPKNGEIDIMEHLNFDDKIYQTVHSYYTLNLKQKENPPHGGTAKINKDDFNVFGLKWYPDKLVFSVNGEDTFTYPKINDVDVSQWPFDQEFYIMIDQQLGGNWVGEIKQEDLPVNLIVDYIRVYQF